MSPEELSIVNQKIANGELYFHPGIQVEISLEQGLITENQTYFYPIVDDIVLLRKDTAVTAKNRTKNPLLRVTQQTVEAFYTEFKPLKKGDNSHVGLKQMRSKPLSNEQLSELKGLLPRSGDCFLSAVTHDVDALHNLVFNTHFNQYLHIDFSLDRLRVIKAEMKDNTLLILCDNANLPFAEESIDALFSFDYINEYDKADQTQAYQELKRVLKGNGHSVVLYDKDKPLHAQAQFKSDQLSKKALGIVAPWKKKKVPSIYFHPVKTHSNDDTSGDLYTKTSLGRQFS